MSIEQQKQLNNYVNMILKVAFGAVAWFAASTFSEMKDSIKIIGTDVGSIKDRMIRMEDKVENQASVINDLKTKVK